MLRKSLPGSSKLAALFSVDFNNNYEFEYFDALTSVRATLGKSVQRAKEQF